jgi:hypothetical protein
MINKLANLLRLESGIHSLEFLHAIGKMLEEANMFGF